ncbi:MAG: site-2 protease family protein [Phycisphaerales bacterium]|jgi:regulator of sigma E protease|nr:site-2 protease family protein [Phycisphaerales bacterium]
MDLFISGFNILVIALGFGTLIFIHELGHFAAAKWAGIRTHAFAIGFGPPIFSWRRGLGFCWGSSEVVVRRKCGRAAMQMTDRELAEEGLGETEYSVRWLPLGGFVRMLGQDDLDPGDRAVTDRGFSSVSIGKRMIVISAGVIMNVLLAIVCFVIAFSVGVPFEAAVIGEVAPNAPASRAVAVDGSVPAGLRPGDVIKSIDGQQAEAFVDVQVAAGMSIPGEALRMVVQRQGSDIAFDVVPEESPVTGMRGIGVMPAASLTLSTIGDLRDMVESVVSTLDIAAEVGPGWSIDTIDQQKVANWGDLERASMDVGGGSMAVGWAGPDGQSVGSTLSATPQWQTLVYAGATASSVVGYELGIGGFVPLVKIDRVPAGSVNEGVLLPGDVVLAVGGVDGPRMRGFRAAIAEAPGDTLAMRVRRGDEPIDLVVHLTRSGLMGRTAMAGVFPAYAWDCPLMAAPMMSVEGGDETLAASVPDGVLPGSRWVSVDGVQIGSWRDVWMAFRAAAARGAEALSVEIENPTIGRERRAVMLPIPSSARSAMAGLQWQPPLPSWCFDSLNVVRSSDGNPIRALSMGVQETWKFIVVTYLTIDRLVRGSVGVEHLHGPVGIVHVGTKVMSRGFMYLLFFLGIISVNLAVLNFLPLPIVDGGMFLYLVYEKIRGVPPPIGFQNAAMLLGLMLILTAFVVTFYNDVMRLIQ